MSLSLFRNCFFLQSKINNKSFKSAVRYYAAQMLWDERCVTCGRAVQVQTK